MTPNFPFNVPLFVKTLYRASVHTTKSLYIKTASFCDILLGVDPFLERSNSNDSPLFPIHLCVGKDHVFVIVTCSY